VSPGSKSRLVLSTWQGIVWWGLPVAIITAVMRHARDHGTAFAGFLTTDFAIQLGINVVITGLLGGSLFAWLLRRMFDRK
jgi:hypothetical protein